MKCRRKTERKPHNLNRADSLFISLSLFFNDHTDTTEIYCNSGPSILEVAREPHHLVTIMSSILVLVRIPNKEDFPPTSYVEQMLSSGFVRCKNV